MKMHVPDVYGEQHILYIIYYIIILYYYIILLILYNIYIYIFIRCSAPVTHHCLCEARCGKELQHGVAPDHTRTHDLLMNRLSLVLLLTRVCLSMIAFRTFMVCVKQTRVPIVVC